MSVPKFPDIPDGYHINDSIAQILTSIAMEEIGLSHIINAEGEKIQYVLGTLEDGFKPDTPPTVNQVIEMNESVKDMLNQVASNQMFLMGKMNLALNTYNKKGNNGGGSGTCPECPNCPVCPNCPEYPDITVGVRIISNRGTIIKNTIYLPQGQTDDLTAIVMTSGTNSVTWTHGNPIGFTFAEQGNQAKVRATNNAPIGSSFTVTATSTADGTKHDTVKIIVIDPAARGVVVGDDGKLYADYGDNTFKEMDPNGTIIGDFICGGLDRTPGTVDDRSDVIVTDSGVKYLGPNADDSYQKAGLDGLLDTEDDEFVWKIDEIDEIGPCNETDIPSSVQVRKIIITPTSAEVMKGGTQLFAATVFMSNDSIDNAGVTWSVQPAGDAAITNVGLLTVNSNATASTLIVTATSVTNPSVSQSATVIVKSAISNVPEGVDGKTLTANRAGDKSDWIEIAKNGNYSLIVRKNYINILDNATNYGNPVYQYTPFGPNNKYASSKVRTIINDWFRGTAGSAADNLPSNANLRNFTVRNTALDEIGSGTVAAGINDGFSKPLEISDGNGHDVAFALSYGEAANFDSMRYLWDGGTSAPSNQIAQENFAKMNMPTGDKAYNSFWLRSPGNSGDSESILYSYGDIFQKYIDGSGGEYSLVYPAVWVKSAIFDS